MWPLRSLCYRTDLFLAEASAAGEVIDRGRYVVLRTPSNPDFWWGNFLLHREPPDVETALADQRRELPEARTTLVAWDSPDGDRGAVDDFLAEGFAYDESSVLTASAADLARPPRWNANVEIVRLASESQWTAAIEAHMNAFAPRRSGTLGDLRTFVERQFATFRALDARGAGRWWGALVNGELAGSLGLVQVGDPTGPPLGRFQLVGVDPRFGRAGVCSTLVYDVARRALGEEGFATLVMAADATYHAARVYESVGFRRTETLVAAIKKPPKA